MHRMEGNRIVMLDVEKDGSVVERIPSLGQDSTTANTLLGAMYPGVKVAIVSVPTEVLEDHEESAVARTLTGVRHNGVHYKMVGASGSAKNGKYYFAMPLTSQNLRNASRCGRKPRSRTSASSFPTSRLCARRPMRP